MQGRPPFLQCCIATMFFSVLCVLLLGSDSCLSCGNPLPLMRRVIGTVAAPSCRDALQAEAKLAVPRGEGEPFRCVTPKP
jgi:hypothetical protein